MNTASFLEKELKDFYKTLPLSRDETTICLHELSVN